jgi:hypothetical protein
MLRLFAGGQRSVVAIVLGNPETRKIGDSLRGLKLGEPSELRRAVYRVAFSSLLCLTCCSRGLPIKSSQLGGGNEHNLLTRVAVDPYQIVHSEGPAVDKAIHKGWSLIPDFIPYFFQESVLAVSPTGD